MPQLNLFAVAIKTIKCYQPQNILDTLSNVKMLSILLVVDNKEIGENDYNISVSFM